MITTTFSTPPCVCRQQNISSAETDGQIIDSGTRFGADGEDPALALQCRIGNASVRNKNGHDLTYWMSHPATGWCIPYRPSRWQAGKGPEEVQGRGWGPGEVPGTGWRGAGAGGGGCIRDEIGDALK
jgi:hypothetical protein